MWPSRSTLFWVAWRTFRGIRVGVAAISAILLLAAVADIAGYRIAYPTAADRARFAPGLAANASLRILYGIPYDVTHIGGYLAWRLGGIGAIIAAAWGVFATIGALRGEEDVGRWEIVLAGRIGRASSLVAAMLALMAGVFVMWLVMALGILAAGWAKGDMAFGACLYLALAIVICAPVFSALTALVCQLTPSAQSARLGGGAVLGFFLLLRIAADIGTGTRWLHWLTPFGWAEELRPFAGPRPLVLLLPVVAILATTTAAGMIAARRDVGTGIFTERAARSSDWLLQSPTAAAVRAALPALAAWLAGTAIFAAVIGALVKSVSQLLQNETDLLRRSGLSTRLLSPEGFLSYYFAFFILAACIVAMANLSAAREEEEAGRLETLLAGPVSRQRWLAGRLALAFVSAALLALVAALVSWVAANSQGASIALGGLLKAAVNALPITLLFLGLAAMVFGLVPRLTAGLGYGMIGVSFLWELLGPVLKAPSWVLDLSPFHHVADVPSYPFNTGAAITMAALGLVSLIVGVRLFTRRDLVQA